jgi:hypothetical protein
MWAAVTVLAVGLGGMAMAQDAPPTPPQDRAGQGRGMRRDFHGVGGQITAIEGSTVTLQTFRGETAKVKITSSTRLMKDGNEVKLSEFKVGDRVFAAGEQDKDGVWTAQMFGQRATGVTGPRGGMMNAKPEDNGKTYIFGELVKIDGTKLTVKKPDNTEQVIEVDDDTSFQNERRESVTLADIQAGDMVRGHGEVKSGVFVPKDLFAGRPRKPRPGAPSAPPMDSAPPSPKQAAPDSNEPAK